jgi:hypothetical protein
MRLLVLAAVATAAIAPDAVAATGGASAAAPSEPPTATAALLPNGRAAAPPGAPELVRAVIAAGNRIAGKPYRWGGGHRRWRDRGYDCSGSVSYALHGADLVEWAYDSTGFMRYGDPGPGRWITIYANRRHVFMVVAGLRFDTSGADPSRWQELPRDTSRFRVRHPEGL